MKYLIYYTFLLCLGTNILEAQNPMVFDQYNSSYVSDLEYVNDSTYVVALRVGNEKNHSTLQWYKDSEFLYDLKYVDQVTKQNLRKVNDQLYLDYIYRYYCDVLSSGFITIPADTSWVRSEYAHPYLYFGDTLQAVRISDSLSIILNERNQLFYKDSSRLSFQTEQLSLNGNILLQKLETNIALLGDNSSIIRDVAKLDSSDLVLSHANNRGLEIIVYNDKYYLLGSKKISIFEKNGQLLETIEYPDSLQVLDMIVDHEDKLLILGTKEDQNIQSHHIFQLMDLFSWEETYTNSDLNFSFREMRLSPKNEVILLGSTKINANEKEYPEMGVILNTSNTIQYSPDFSIEYSGTSIEIESDAYYRIKASVTVNNQSDKDAYNVHVYSTEFGCSYDFYFYCGCFSLRNTIPYIPANSSVDIYLETFIDTIIELVPEVCFYVSGADQLYDVNQNDNTTCGLLLDVEDLDLKESVLDLFPNPASHVLRSKSAEYEDQFEIIDLQGKVLKRTTYQEGINIYDLNPGFYFARDLTNSTIGKFLKF
ncbi:T9SS type A sorting domain-containing protein [Portibacter lacus]|uniref:Secretion system C-terminal sorting domain-containing protein n=1 Tax=Portibacter lacus TaxID=1099794 RepID=A0AA37WHE4_9BACT|nr:T9SS type A sorting domain-containing protein [Portibacter lacus]GLR19214.1 hypothetical protein GCM10007940_38300 [Portibacter lacus]